MYILIERFIDKLKKEQINEFALKNNIILNESELDFSYNFILKNWRFILSNHGEFDLSKYKQQFTEENYFKIVELIKVLKNKYSNYL